MYTMSFDGCRAKLKRAAEHRDTLFNYSTELHKREYLTVMRADLDQGTGYHVFTIAEVPDYDPILTQMGLVLGDCLQNQRASLDHLAFQFALYANDGEVADEDSYQFPIGDDEHRFRSGVGRYLKGVHDDYVKFIESYQPYVPFRERRYGALGDGETDLSTPNHHPLRVLRELSNLDKHRLITPVLVLDNMVTLAEGVRYSRMPPDLLPDGKVPEAGKGQEIRAHVMSARLAAAPDHIDEAGYLPANPVVVGAGTLLGAVDSIQHFISTLIEDAENLPLPT